MRERNPGHLDLRRLSHRRPSPVAWKATGEALASLAGQLGLLSAAAVELRGEIRPEGEDGFRLEARLRAQVTQACVATLAPVPAAVEADVLRRYVAGLAMPEGGEHEIPEDDSIEPLRDRIDLAELAAEALSLALPDYPRAAPVAADRPSAGPGTPAAPVAAAAGGGVPEPPRANRPFADLAERIAPPAGQRPPPRKT